LLFFVIFLAVWERRRSLRAIFSSVGLRRKGSIKRVLWGVALFLLLIVIGLIMQVLSNFLGSIPSAASNNGQIPIWYLWYMVIHSFFPVAVVEEAIGRGYMPDRLMPQHPSSIVKALPAILLSSDVILVFDPFGCWSLGRQCFPNISRFKHSLRSSKNYKHYWSCAYPFSIGRYPNNSLAGLESQINYVRPYLMVVTFQY
jgi:hypothetical protein